ncbi:MAG TPA: hypothetical protein VG777_08460, partial [Thermoanaerobaculia bacterium]|nr:hypothetical protein [Thermoanaerobaculia bacterium]
MRSRQSADVARRMSRSFVASRPTTIWVVTPEARSGLPLRESRESRRPARATFRARRRRATPVESDFSGARESSVRCQVV